MVASSWRRPTWWRSTACCSRRIASGVGVERTFKINSPRIDKIEVVRHGKVRRAQLYFLRDRVGKAATLRERRTNG